MLSSSGALPECAMWVVRWLRTSYLGLQQEHRPATCFPSKDMVDVASPQTESRPLLLARLQDLEACGLGVTLCWLVISFFLIGFRSKTPESKVPK